MQTDSQMGLAAVLQQRNEPQQGSVSQLAPPPAQKAEPPVPGAVKPPMPFPPLPNAPPIPKRPPVPTLPAWPVLPPVADAPAAPPPPAADVPPPSVVPPVALADDFDPGGTPPTAASSTVGFPLDEQAATTTNASARKNDGRSMVLSSVAPISASGRAPNHRKPARDRRRAEFARRARAAIVDDVKINSLFAGTFLILAAGLGAACTDNSGNGAGNPGSAGSKTGTGGNSAGTAGAGGASSGGAGGAGGATPGFMSFMPCTAEGDYVTGTGDAGTAGMPTVSFGTINGTNAYDPQCLETPAGSTVTFSGDFGSHPLVPSTVRGNTTNSPITTVVSNPDGGKISFTFPTAGFYAYYCGEHGTDAGDGMAGVIWVQ